MKIKRLLLVGSASVHTWRYLEGIAPHVGEIWLATNAEVPEGRRPANLAGVLRVDFRFSSFSAVGKLRGWMKSVKPDVVHIHQANSVAWHATRAARGLNIPLMLTTWGSDVLLLPEGNPLMAQMVKSNLTSADMITSDSLYMAARIRELAGNGKRIAILNYGMDALAEPAPSATKSRRVLSCRLHKKLYRIDTILRAWAGVEASGRYPDWRLTVAASGEESGELQALAATLKLERVDFTGFVPAAELSALYRDSRVFVSVPKSDATSISLLEAMGHGCLPLLSNLPANLEWVIDGLNGQIAEDLGRLDAALMQAMDAATDDEKLDEIAMLNRKLISKKALHRDNMAQFAALYGELLHLPENA